MTDNIETLRARASASREELLLFDRRVEAEARAAADRVRAKYRAKYREELEALRGQMYSANNALTEAQERTTHPWLGKRVFRYVTIYSAHRWQSSRTQREVGIVEIFTRQTTIPGNTASWRFSIGDPIVRILKKDGTPGIKIVRLASSQWELVEEEIEA